MRTCWGQEEGQGRLTVLGRVLGWTAGQGDREWQELCL